MLPFSASSGFGSDAIVYGASIMLVVKQIKKLVLIARLLQAKTFSAQANVQRFWLRSSALAGRRSGKVTPGAATLERVKPI